MMLKSSLTRCALLALLLTVWLPGCAPSSPLLASPTPAPLIPPLPQIARQPALGPECSPSCSAALTTEREAWLQQLTPPESPARPASGPMTR